MSAAKTSEKYLTKPLLKQHKGKDGQIQSDNNENLRWKILHKQNEKTNDRTKKKQFFSCDSERIHEKAEEANYINSLLTKKINKANSQKQKEPHSIL